MDQVPEGLVQDLELRCEAAEARAEKAEARVVELEGELATASVKHRCDTCGHEWGSVAHDGDSDKCVMCLKAERDAERKRWRELRAMFERERDYWNGKEVMYRWRTEAKSRNVELVLCEMGEAFLEVLEAHGTYRERVEKALREVLEPLVDSYVSCGHDRDRALKDLEAAKKAVAGVDHALAQGADEEIWPPGWTRGEAVARLVHKYRVLTGTNEDF